MSECIRTGEIRLRAESLGVAFRKLVVRGGSGVRALYFHLGFQLGLHEGRRVNSEKREELHYRSNAFKKEVSRILREQGFAEAEVLGVNIFKKEIKVRIYEGFESDYMTPSNEPACYFTRGFLEGLIEGLTGLKIKESAEVKCRARGDPYCEMIFNL
ncbi:MAG: hypothetical protein DRJ47_03075 [Thermoprotei archaeon]|nr:MAG: hypothetical protein DRJ47_03075 [Thermoprotei archaeon]